ncbi:hypothetical protein EV667_0354 [Ancylobacter aquaticus]|uniref:Uncharacterized protein n=1 Tax=Ancylobacter aquaticus TaxID=100 RepID=A0A4V2PJX6_ANCAQ|nr:hypothetical protein [Ancylobacter aquaticus]TCK30266.1 hypothetical protein EV667_0354 [Ancylobacter aquaticus]
MDHPDKFSDDLPAPAVRPSASVAPAPGEAADPRRRAALAKLGRTALYAAPATVSLMAMTRSARAC